MDSDMSTSVKHVTVQRFGEKVKLLREQHGMTHSELAAALGYASSSYISLLENGKRGASAELIRKISLLFEVSADDLLDDGREVRG
jgi:transcriptional regulator with XRE-family HTH domain